MVALDAHLEQTAFTAKNANLTTSGEWDVDGSIGMDGQTVTLPKGAARGQKIDSIMGVSVGVNGIVVAVSFEFGLLFGLPVAGAGWTAGLSPRFFRRNMTKVFALDKAIYRCSE